jgi:outer membrane protein assembly factor BamA
VVHGRPTVLEGGSTNPRVVRRELPFRVGTLYNVEDAKRALRDIFLLQLFDNVQVVPKPDDDDPQKVAVDIVLKERPLKTAEVELEWGIAPGDKGRPDLVRASFFTQSEAPYVNGVGNEKGGPEQRARREAVRL